VRELQQTLARAIVLSQGGRIEPAHLPADVANGHARPGPKGPRAISENERREEQLRRELIGHLEKHRANVSEIARAMGKARMQIHRWMKRYGLDPRDYRR